MLRRIRVGLLAAANASGLSRLIGASGWRQNRLLILCYHGISDSDLHQWNPSMFMYAEEFRRRLQLLRDAKCHVLGLGEALTRLENGTLPPRSVVLTFDDGFADFHRLAWPILREFGCPATLYLTTYYMLRNVPVFDPALDYLLWTGRNRQLDWPEIVAQPVSLDPAGRELMRKVLQIHAWKMKLTAAEKDGLHTEYYLGTVADLQAADGAWLVSSGRGMARLRSLDGRPLADNPAATARLCALAGF